MASPWTTKDPSGTLQLFQEGLPVRLICTERNAFKTCTPSETLADVVARNRENPFDHFPVTLPDTDMADSNNKIIGVIDITPYMHQTETQLTVKDIMDPLSEEILIGADAGIWAFVRDADLHPFRFVVSGPVISGLVSLSDLQRLPVRGALFAMVTHLEMVMADAIRVKFRQRDEWMSLLSQGRQDKLRSEIAKAKSEDTYIDALHYTQFADKITIIKNLPTLPGAKSSFERDLGQVRSLRDSLAHANDFAATRDDAKNVCKTSRLIDHWIGAITKLPDGGS